ncbi:MAG: S24 family peptidase [Candidatus Sulfotelmatobacter sp.]
MLYNPGNHEDPKLGLARETLRCHGTVKLKAWGTSMLPSLRPGDLLTVRSAAHDEVVPGDIVLVLRDNRFVIHRLVERQQFQDCLSWITRGDAMPQNDPPVAASEVLGRVASVRRANRSFVPSRKVSPLHAKLAWMLCRWDRFRNLALRVHSVRLGEDLTRLLRLIFIRNAFRAGRGFHGGSPSHTPHS